MDLCKSYANNVAKNSPQFTTIVLNLCMQLLNAATFVQNVSTERTKQPSLWAAAKSRCSLPKRTYYDVDFHARRRYTFGKLVDYH